MLWVSIDDLLTFYVTKIVHEDVGRQEVDQGLDVLSHLLLVLTWLQLAEIVVRER